MIIKPTYNTLIGIPYTTLDCWGIVKEFYKLELGMELKSYYDEIPNDNNKACNLISSNKGDFYEVSLSDIKFGDIITIKLMGVEAHIAVYIGSGSILHTMAKTGCIVDRLERCKKMIVGIYRVKIND